MAKETVQFKRTVKGSVGAGMGALFNGSGRQFYVLEHKNASKYHHAGESQKIIIDQIVLGRDGNCQVRFDDESWPSVSRRHAAIEKDPQGWKIIPLSQTNSTLVNGHAIDKEWHLQNGDEIQLAINGPRLGFIVPAGKQSLVSSIKLTERLNLFRAQALRPYKRAIAALCAVLVVACGVGGYVIWNQQKDIVILNNNAKELEAYTARLDSLISAQQKVIDAQRAEIEVITNRSKELEKKLPIDISKHIAKAKKDVYAVRTELTFTITGWGTQTFTSWGTGFLLADGRFMTARHVVHPWMYENVDLMIMNALSQKFEDVTLSAKITAYSTEGSFTIPASAFKCDSSRDVSFSYNHKTYGELILKAAHPLKFEDGQSLGTDEMWGQDWAYAHVDRKGGLEIDASLSRNLNAGTKVHVLGFPAGLGIEDGRTSIEPIYNEMAVSRDGLNKAECIMVSEGAAHGNSGGPVFATKNGRLYVIGIVSRKEEATQQMGAFGIVQQQQQYDQLVPIVNIK